MDSFAAWTIVLSKHLAPAAEAGLCRRLDEKALLAKCCVFVIGKTRVLQECIQWASSSKNAAALQKESHK